MIEINENFEQILTPASALIIYKSVEGNRTYIESYDIDEAGKMRNAHPLSMEESTVLATSLTDSKDLSGCFLKSEGLLPENLLYISPGVNGSAIWYTQAKKVSLRFAASLGIPDGMASIPPLVWKASKTSLQLFAISSNKGRKPKADQVLFHAPFFNLYSSGSVCMGTVDIDIEEHCALETFISKWEQYFFDSYFSHSMSGHNPVKENLVGLWKNQIKKGNPFPAEVLIKTNVKLKDLIYEKN